MSIFKAYKNHSVVECSNCGKRLHGMDRDISASGYPRGRGQYKQKCPECEVTTYYDVK